MILDFYELSMMFFVYSILGWVVEVLYATVDDRCFLNRGMLYGGICPIYGFGVIFLVVVLAPFRRQLWLLFIAAVVATTLLELIAGFILHRFFGQRWWDYTDERLNIGGYICPKFSLAWGVVGMLVVAFAHPVFLRLLILIPREIGFIFLAGAYLYFAVDVLATFLSLCKSRRFARFQAYIEYRFLFLSDAIGNRIFNSFFFLICFRDHNLTFFERFTDPFPRVARRNSRRAYFGFGRGGRRIDSRQIHRRITSRFSRRGDGGHGIEL